MNNILVTDRYYPNDPQFQHEYDYMISDIGEGKALNSDGDRQDLTRARASYGAVEFRAPEVHGNEGWSFKAEAFSFGVIASKIMECRRHVCKAPPPESITTRVEGSQENTPPESDLTEYIVPTEVRKAIEPCMSHCPDNRPAMRKVVNALNDVFPGVMPDSPSHETNEKIKWTCWRWTDPLNHVGGNNNVVPKQALDDFESILQIDELQL